MIERPMDVPDLFPVRKSAKQKKAFRDQAQAYFESLGYSCTTEKGSFGARNLVIGDADSAQYLITAHYDTCARLPFPNLVTPCNFLSFLGYQLFTFFYMFAFVGFVGVLVTLISGDAFIGFLGWYCALIVFMILIYVGPSNKHNANDNTSGVVSVLEIARTIPEDLRSKVCFVLFDLEEAGLIGSSSYRKNHRKATDHQVILNIDCVGEGDDIVLFPTSKLKKDQIKLDALHLGCKEYAHKKVWSREKGFAFYPSDQANFPYGVGIAALKQSWAGLYLGKIHTSRDTVLDTENIGVLRDSLVSVLRGNDVIQDV